MAVVTLNIHHRGVRGNEVPGWLREIVLVYLARIVGLKFDISIQRIKEAEQMQRESRISEVRTRNARIDFKAANVVMRVQVSSCFAVA